MRNGICRNQIFRLARIALIRREADEELLNVKIRKAKHHYIKKYEARIAVLRAKAYEMSSTFVRNSAADDRLDEYVPESVAAYIRKKSPLWCITVLRIKFGMADKIKTEKNTAVNIDEKKLSELRAIISEYTDISGRRLSHTLSVEKECGVLAEIFGLCGNDRRDFVRRRFCMI